MLQRIFLRSDVEPVTVFAAADQLGFQPVSVVREDGAQMRALPFATYAMFDDDPDSISALSAEFRSAERPAHKLEYIRNRQALVAYVEVSGRGAAALRRELEPYLPHYEREPYARATGGEPLEERVTALFHLAVSKGPVPEPHVLQLVREFLAHDDAAVRKTAVLAAVFFQWPAVFAMLDERLAQETAADVREQLQVAVGKRTLEVVGFGQVVARSGPHVEAIWIRRDGDERYVVSAVPSIVYNLSLEDVVTTAQRDGEWVVTGIAERAGHRTLRVDGDPAALEPILRSHRVRCECPTPERLAIDVPPEVDLGAVTATLDAAGVFWELADPRPELATIASPG